MVVGTCHALGGYEPDLRHRSSDADVQLELVRAAAAVALMPDLPLPSNDPALAIGDIAEATRPCHTRREGGRMMRRWVRYDAPVMVCVDLDDDGYQGKVVNVVLATDDGDIPLARDHLGHFLVYDEQMNRLTDDGIEPDTRAITIAEYREWPQPDDWEQGPDPLRYPGLYDIDPDEINPSEDDERGDGEPLDLDHTQPARAD